MSDEWKSHIEEILASPGVTVVVGDVDTGKSSFCVLLSNAAFAAGLPAVAVDSDIGQSEIGPPGTIGLGVVESEIETLSQLRPKSLYFVGSTSPPGHLVATITGTKKMCEQGLELGRRLVIVDTCGFIHGPTARKLKTHKIDLLNARHIVALQKSSESEHFIRLFDSREDCTVHRLHVASDARSKPPLLRSQRRAVRFQEYFANGSVKEIKLDSVSTSGTWLRTGTPLETKYLKFAEKELQTPVIYGESVGRGVYLVIKGVYNGRGVEKLQEQFRTKSIVVSVASAYPNLLVGLLGSRFELLAIGIIKGLDFRSQTISIYTPLRSTAPVKVIRFGDLKLRPGGTEIGRTRPGELQ
jgi:polynucleotide 5'-hydroxyl-kinase GRC3/NOL9